jgi:hypothetical protein
MCTVTDKFTKWITLIPGKSTWEAKEWAIAYYDYVYSKFGLPGVIISDRDPKFTSQFWKELFKRTGTRLALTAAYHPSADGQSERTNQTVETALRCLIADAANERPISEWDELLPDSEYALNTSTSAATGYSPFLLLYGIHPRPEIDPSSAPARYEDVEEFLQDRRRIREDAAENIKLAQARMTKYYDAKHTRIKDTDQVWLKLAKGTDVGYRLPHMSALDVRKVGPFPIKRRIGKVAFELELPDYLKIHPVISCVHLEPALPEHLNARPPPPPLTTEEGEKYSIDRIVRKEQRRKPGDKSRRTYYRVRWQGYGPNEDTWESADDLQEQVPELVRAFESSLASCSRRR